ncbi:MAG: hypothetical protein IH860_02915 [Chloroflexi bacterium]|nr:hypothetical protein [Chloroflexota bacterium]
MQLAKGEQGIIIKGYLTELEGQMSKMVVYGNKPTVDGNKIVICRLYRCANQIKSAADVLKAGMRTAE